MKKIFACLLLFSVLLPFAALAEEAIPEDIEIMEVSAEDAELSDDPIVVEEQPLHYGDASAAVAELQRQLAALCYYSGEISGSYGDQTRTAVATFQQDHYLEATGDADLATLALLYETVYRPLRLGCMGEDVKRLQERLTELGYYTGKLSGTYMPGTQEAVYNFQHYAGEMATGYADAETQMLLYAADALPYQEALAAMPAATPAPTTLDMIDDIPRTPTPHVAFEKTLKYESKGALVKTLQQRLIELGYYDGNVSGNFLGHTRNAVKAFQTQNGIKVDGVVGESTWNAIFNDIDVRAVDDAPKPTPAPTPIPYAITVDVQNQVTTVYGLDENGEYTKVVRQMLCSTGTRANPSDVGDWVLSGRNARGAYFPKWGGHAHYWTKINDSIAFHSVLYSAPSDTMTLKVSSYKNLGKRASHGCIRLTLADSKWIYQNIGAGTVVTITEDLPADPELRDALKLPPLDYSCMMPIVTPQPTASPVYVSGAQPPQPFKTLKKNSESADVYWLQCKLKELGYYQGYVSGKYLGGTVNAVKAFQKDHGIKVTGTANVATLEAIYAAELAATPTPAPEATPTPAMPTPTPAPLG